MLSIIPSFHYEGHTVSLIIEKMILIRLIPYDTRMEIIEVFLKYMYITIKPYKKNKTIFIVSSMLKSGITIFPLVCRLLVSETANSLFKTNILCYLICFTIIVSKTEKISFYYLMKLTNRIIMLVCFFPDIYVAKLILFQQPGVLKL